MSTQDTPPQTLFSRIWGYPIVHNTVLVAGEYYNHVKSYNPHSKMVLETAETYGSQLASSYWAKLNQYSGQPLVEDLICKADMFGCQQLDKIEDVCMKLKKASPNNVIHSVEHAISGTKVEGVLVKALNLVNIAVDTLLPALEEEEPSKNETDASSCSSSEETALVRATTPVLLKLRGRLSKKGVLALPANTYHGVKDLALYGLPQLQLYVNTLSSLFTYILTAKDVTYLKGAYISQAVLEHIMQSLHTASSAFKTLANIFKNFDTIEARTSVVELAKMISASKDNISKAISNFHLAEKLKQEGSIILLHAGEALAHPIESLESGYTYVSYADIAIFKKVADSLELAIQTVVQSFSADKFKQS